MAEFNPRPKAPCRFFSQGKCRNGEACQFSHEPASVSSISSGVESMGVGLSSSARITPVTNRAQRPCAFFAKGTCKNGESCQFAHVGTPSPKPAHVEAREALPRGVEALLSQSNVDAAYSIDVECVATGTGHRDRSVAQIGVIDVNGRVLLNAYVKPALPIVSYMTPLTGLTAELMEAEGKSLEDAIAELRSVLPKTAVLVGTNIAKDTEWLNLKEGVDFASLIDLSALFRVWDGKRQVYFGQDHIAKAWLGATRLPGQSHDAVGDAAISMQLLHAFNTAHRDPAQLETLRKATLLSPRDPSFAMRNPVFEGVCQGNRKLCKCGQPHFS